MKESNRGWRLDYFVVSEKLLDIVDDSCMRDKVPGSDHCPIVLTLFTGKEKREKPLIIPPFPITTVPVGYKGPRKSKTTIDDNSQEVNENEPIKLSVRKSDEDSDYAELEKPKDQNVEENPNSKNEENNYDSDQYIPTKEKRGPYKKHKKWYRKTPAKKKPVVKSAIAATAAAASTSSSSEEEMEEEEDEEEEIKVKPIKINEGLTIIPSSIKKKTVHTGRGILLTQETIIIDAANYEKAKASSRRQSITSDNEEGEKEKSKIVKKKGRKSKAEKLAEELERIAVEAEEEAKVRAKSRIKSNSSSESSKQKLKEKNEKSQSLEYDNGKKAKYSKKSKHQNPYERKHKGVISYKETRTYHKRTNSDEENGEIKAEPEKNVKPKKRPYHRRTESELLGVTAKRPYHKHSQTSENKVEEPPPKRPYHKHKDKAETKIEEIPAKRPYHRHNNDKTDKKVEEIPAKRPYHRHKDKSENKVEESPTKRPYHRRDNTKAVFDELPLTRPYHKHKEKAVENKSTESTDKSTKSVESNDIIQLEEPSPYQKGRRGRKSNAQLEEERRRYEELKRKLEEQKRMGKESESNNNNVNLLQQKENQQSESVSNTITTSDFFQQTDFVSNYYQNKSINQNQNINKVTEENQQNLSIINSETQNSNKESDKPVSSTQSRSLPSLPLAISSIVAMLSGSSSSNKITEDKEKK